MEYSPTKIDIAAEGIPPIQAPLPAQFNDNQGNLLNPDWKRVGRILKYKVISDTDTLVAGDGIMIDFIDEELDGTMLISAAAYVSTPSSGGNVTVQVQNVTQAKDCFSIGLVIDANEYSTLTGVTPYIIDDSIVYHAGDQLSIDIDGAGTGTSGLIVKLSFQ